MKKTFYIVIQKAINCGPSHPFFAPRISVRRGQSLKPNQRLVVIELEIPDDTFKDPPLRAAVQIKTEDIVRPTVKSLKPEASR